MAEFVMKSLVKKNGLEKEYRIDSAATSREEIGNGIHPGSRRKMQQMGIDYTNHRARQITIDDYNDYDLLIGMDRENLYNMQRILGEDTEGKMHLLLEYSQKNTGKTRDIADPWYTGNFDDTYNDIIEGCNGLLRTLCQVKQKVQY